MIHVKCKCPFCQKSLMDKEQLIHGAESVSLNCKLEESSGGTEGTVKLSSSYGDYSYTASLEIPMNTVVEFSCPYCHKALSSTRSCEICEAPMTALQLDRGGKIQFCSRRGCKKHLIEFEDAEAELLEFYNQYSPYLEG